MKAVQRYDSGQVHQLAAIHVVHDVCRRMGDGLIVHMLEHPCGGDGNGRTSALQEHTVVALDPWLALHNYGITFQKLFYFLVDGV